MTGSMYAAVSGLKAHMSALNVIGNNVANVNTLGYKTTRYTFNEALYTTQRSGSDGSNTSGGRNPAQVGFGASIGTIDLDMSTKNYTPTGHNLDTMIDGDGFFIVGDKMVGSGEARKIATDGSEDEILKSMNLTRLGNFEIDAKGYLVDGNGSVVWGFVRAAVDPSAQFTIPASTEGGTAEKKALTALTAADVETLRRQGIELMDVTYSSSGTVESATMVGSELGTIRLPVIKTTVKGSAATENNVTTFTETTPREASAELVWPTSSLQDGAEVGTSGYIKADGTDTTTASEVAGQVTYERVQPDTLSINEKTGALTVTTTDGTYVVGYLAIAKVTNPNGVTHVDGRYYKALEGAGDIRATSIGGVVSGVDSAGDTQVLTGGLESSGTDLATEITNMITVQRGYQANTRIITVTDSMLEELVNMKR